MTDELYEAIDSAQRRSINIMRERFGEEQTWSIISPRLEKAFIDLKKADAPNAETATALVGIHEKFISMARAAFAGNPSWSAMEEEIDAILGQRGLIELVRIVLEDY